MIEELKVGDIAPNVNLKNQDNEDVNLKDYEGKWVVLYFYPKDNTPGCTTEAIDFTMNKDKFAEKNAVILGVSADSIDKHKKFCEKKELTITLLSDEEKTALNDYSVWQLKKNYGKEYFGIVRTTYLISPEGKIAHVWNKVRVKGHVESVLEKLDELQG